MIPQARSRYGSHRSGTKLEDANGVLYLAKGQRAHSALRLSYIPTSPFFRQSTFPWIYIEVMSDLLYDRSTNLRMENIMKIKILCCLVAAGLLLTGCSADKEVQDNTNAQQAENVSGENSENVDEGEDYILTFTAKTVEGEEITSDIFADSRLTMMNIWATYCNPCLQEMPDLGEIAAAYDKADFQMIGIISDVMEGDDVEYAKALIEHTKANYPHLVLSESLYFNLVNGVDAVPTTFFVNKSGVVLGYVVGAQSKETWEEIIDDLLEKNQ